MSWQVMELLVEAPDEVDLSVSRNVVVRRPLVKPTLQVDGSPTKVAQGIILRTAVQDTGVTVHTTMMAKVNSCGGGGQCKTCWVNVVEGAENLSELTAVEKKFVGSKKPDTYRLSCQALVNGDVSVEIPKQ